MDDPPHGWTADLSDRYEIVREHGKGGMATVYLAVDRKHDRHVALKVLAPELAAGIGAERFLREIQISAHLNHPHIVPLLDSGLVDGRPFYVMPFVEGESLRQRLAREGVLPLEEALRIAGDVAEALIYAHDHAVIHRDIKPANILLTAGSAIVTDFGIAVAVDEASEPHLTRTGLSVGTPGYMSPEQAGGDGELDGRTDQYALAAVLFEMLAGDPPYTGRTARAILGRQLSQPVPDISALRSSVPEDVSGLLRRALAQTPADRFRSTREFAEAVEGVVHRTAVTGNAFRPPRRLAVWLALAVALGLGAAVWPLASWDARQVRPPPADSVSGDPFTYAVFPFRSSLGDTLAVGEELRLHDALARWDGIHVVQDFQLRKRMERTSAADLSLDQAAEVARDLGAGRLLTGRLDWLGDSIRVQATLYEASRQPTQIESVTSVISSSLAGADSVFAMLADQLLFRGDPPETVPEAGRRSYPANLAFLVGSRALEDWKLEEADVAFSRATQLDGDFARAHLWTALVRAWNDSETAAWRMSAEQAVVHGTQLSRQEARMATALSAQADGRFEEACNLWRDLTREYDTDFTAWYGLAACLHADPLVVRDATSPSGWRFRSSYEEAISAYRKAFDRLPSMLESFSSQSYQALRRLLLISGYHLRTGHSELPEDSRFFAFAILREDTLAYIPWPADVAFEPQARPSQLEQAEAVRHQRRLFLEVARSWVADSRNSAAAREALALGLLMNGHGSALDTLLAGQALARTAEERRALAATEVWMRVLLGLPGDGSYLRRAHRLADSLLADSMDELQPEVAAGLAALLGRSTVAAAHARSISPDPDLELSPINQSHARALRVFAALLGPADSLVRLERRLSDALERVFPAERRAAAREQWLAVPATLVFPRLPFPSATVLEDWLVATQLRAASGDTARVVSRLRRAQDERRGVLPYALTLDALLPEAELLASLGRPRDAVELIDPTLADLPLLDLEQIARPELWAVLVRLAALRADLASELGDEEEARDWAGAVLILWSDADPHVSWILRRMERIAGRTE